MRDETKQKLIERADVDHLKAGLAKTEMRRVDDIQFWHGRAETAEEKEHLVALVEIALLRTKRLMYKARSQAAVTDFGHLGSAEDYVECRRAEQCIFNNLKHMKKTNE